MRVFRLLLVVLAAAIPAAAAGAGAHSPAGVIAFSRCGPDGCGNGTDIWLIKQDGSGLRRVTRQGVHNEFPTWAPDGERLAFSRSDGFYGGIWTLNLTTGRAREVTGAFALDKQPSWSPDGAKIAFVRTFQRGGSELDAVGSSGSHLRRLAHGTGDFRHPSWSPHARLLAFAYSPDPKKHHYRIYLVRANGTHRRELAGDPKHDYWDPSWSPDGRRIAFSVVGRRGKAFSADLEVVDTDGSKQRTILRAPRDTVYFSPSWSPDGRTIAFIVLNGRTRQGRLAFVSAGGKGLRILRQIISDNRSPVWRPFLGRIRRPSA